MLINIVGAGTGGAENGVSNVDIPDDGTIEGIQVSHRALLNADAEYSIAELSFISTSQISTNDGRGSIVISKAMMSLLTSGGSSSVANFFVPTDIDVAGGERLYINLDATAGVVTNVNFIVHFKQTGRGRRATRRTTRT